MAPKTQTNAAKLALCHQWILKSGVAHSLKDLEKALTSVASINSMAVKDYVQGLTDESLIRVEKIGSGNWYWAFPSEARVHKEQLLAKAQDENDKLTATIKELQTKIDQETVARSVSDSGEEDKVDRDAMQDLHASLTRDVQTLRQELSAYSDQDPTELARRTQALEDIKTRAILLTEQIQAMEGWIKDRIDRPSLLAWKKETYGVEFDEMEEGLREI